MDLPQTHYATAEDGVSIAYQIVGDGPVDLVVDLVMVGNVEMIWEFEPVADFLERLAAFSRLILHDRRGTGLSGGGSRLPDLETRTTDILAVLDASRTARPALLGSTTGGAAYAMLAATHPERVSSLIWFGPMAKTSWSPDYPWGETAEEQASWLPLGTIWGTPEAAGKFIEDNAPSRIGDERLARDLARITRHYMSPSTWAEFVRTWNETDVSSVLGSLRCPTLLLDREAGPFGPDEALHIQTLIPGAKLTLLPGEDFPMFFGDLGAVVDAVREFLGVETPPVVPDTVLATVLFTDIVGSSKKAADVGDSAWAETLREHDRIARDQVERFGGRYDHSTGDGFLATFPGPARAVRCAQAIAAEVRPLGLEIRAACHTGEVDLAPEGAQGVTVHIGARVAALAGADQILVSSTVRDLTPGSGLSFEDAGEHQLKGIPDPWHLYKVVTS